MKYLITSLLLACSSLGLLLAQPSPTPPKMGLSLSGGGAKGLAHIGVLKVLEANGIFPDYLTGTSMGSIVGGLYATGYTPAQLEELATSLEWANYFSDSYSRSLQPIDQRNKADRYQLTFALENGSLKIPQGLIGGKKIMTLLTGLTAGVHDVGSFDDLYIPFRCVAANLETGEGYVFGEGRLDKGIRASMSIPSAFAPLTYDSLLLVDGMMARNLPTQDCIDMGSDFVIGVDVGDPLYSRDQLNSVLRVLEQTSSYVIATSNEEQLALTDFLIDPDLSEYTTLSYDQAAGIIKQGELAAEAALPYLQAYLDSIGWEARPLPERPLLQRDSFQVVEIRYEAERHTTRKTLRQLLNIKLPAQLTVAELEHKVSELYASGFFNSVDYHLQRSGGVTGEYILVLNATPTPNIYVRGSINYDLDFNAGLLINFTARNQIGYGSLLSADLRVSEFPGFWLDYTINTRTNPSFGVRVYATGQIIPGERYDQGEILDEFSYHHYTTGIDLQTNISKQWNFRVGAGGEHFSYNPKFFSLEEVDSRHQRWRAYARLLRDTYDRTYFPTEGSLSELWFDLNLRGRIESAEMPDQSLRTDDVWTVGAHVHKVLRLGHRWWLDGTAGAGHTQVKRLQGLLLFNIGRAIPDQQRFLEVYGLNLGEMRYSTFGFGRIQLRHKIGGGTFLGLGYNYGLGGNITPDRRMRRDDINGLGLELGQVTPLGPLRFTAEYNLLYQRFNYSFYAGYRF